MVGVYYNKSAFKALGFTHTPRTLAEFEGMLAKAKTAGDVPLETGNLEKWPALHYFYALADVYCPVAKLRSWIYGDKHSTIDLPCAKSALDRLASWGANGYIPSSANGTAYADALTAFGKGTGVFMLTGSWAQAGFDQQSPGQFGFFLLPGLKAGAPPVATGALTPPYGISTKSKNPQAAAQWLDYLLTPKVSTKLAAVGVLPALKASTFKPKTGTALADLYKGWQSVLNANGLGLYFDWSTPKMLDVTDAPLQAIVAGKAGGAADLLQQMQKEWQSFHS
jgi:raffinose/stachyose/melibiose transport system substrate-binding protein